MQGIKLLREASRWPPGGDFEGPLGPVAGPHFREEEGQHRWAKQFRQSDQEADFCSESAGAFEWHTSC